MQRQRAEAETVTSLYWVMAEAASNLNSNQREVTDVFYSSSQSDSYAGRVDYLPFPRVVEMTLSEARMESRLNRVLGIL